MLYLFIYIHILDLSNKHTQRFAESQVHCVPWFLPRLDSQSICDPWTQREFDTALNNFTPDKQCGCLNDCEYTEYEVTAESARFR